MKNIKKALILSLSVLLILAFANFSFAASSISAKNDTSTNESSNTSDNEADNKATNNTSLNTASNNTSTNSSTNASKPISSSNSSGNLPNTGIEDTYLNFALILLLAIVLGMFSLVQYNKIVKKEE